jgi:hypothetical protein
MKKVFLSARLRELAARSRRIVEFAGGPGFEALEELAVQLRAMQLYAHNAHNQTRGESFFGDHEFLGGLYAAYTEGYDDVVELLIGEGAVPDLRDFQMRAATALAGMGDGECFCSLLGAEGKLQQIVESIAAAGVDQGILQIVGSLAQASKARVYKLKQRMAEDEEEEDESDDIS